MAPQGLFPAPLPSHLLAASKVLAHFKLLGRAMAKALQDNRLLDLPLSYVFYRYWHCIRDSVASRWVPVASLAVLSPLVHVLCSLSSGGKTLTMSFGHSAVHVQ